MMVGAHPERGGLTSEGFVPTRLMVTVGATTVYQGWQPSEMGAALHAAFLSVVKARNPELAVSLHNWPAPKPFCIRPLMELGELRWRFEVTVLDDSLASACDVFEPSSSLRLGSRALHVIEVNRIQTSYADLYGKARPALTHRFQLRSPTVKRLRTPTGRSRPWPMPVPSIVFGSLFDRWATFAPNIPLSDVTPDVIEHGIDVVELDLRTEHHRISAKGFIIGAVGTIAYRVDREAPTECQRDLSALAAFAEYCGVGDQTTKGMGWAEPLGSR